MATYADIVASTLPFEGFYTGSGAAVLYDNKIHILGFIDGEDKHYSWNGNIWVEESILPVESTLYAGAIVYNNKIHLFSDYAHYIWDGLSWTRESNLPYSYYHGSTVVYNNKIHILGSDDRDNYTKHFSWNGTIWQEESTLPYNFYESCAVIYDNKIHILGTYDYGNQRKHFSWNGTTWQEEIELPYNFSDGCAVIFNNKIHILGGVSSKKHYYLENSTWIEESDLPYENDFWEGAAFVYNNEINTLGNYNTAEHTKHYIINHLIKSINKVVYGNKTLIDLSDDTVQSSDLVEGKTAHDNTGNIIIGTRPSYCKYDSKNCIQALPISNFTDTRTVMMRLKDNVPVYGYYGNKAVYLETNTVGDIESTITIATPPAGQENTFVLKVMYLNSNQMLIQYYWDTGSGYLSPTYLRCITLKKDNSLAQGAAVTISGTPSATISCETELIKGLFDSYLAINSNITISTGARTLTAKRVTLNYTTGALTQDSSTLINVSSNTNTAINDSSVISEKGGFFYKNASDEEYVAIFGSYQSGNYRNCSLAAADSKGNLSNIGWKDHYVLGTLKNGLIATVKIKDKIYLWNYDHTDTSNIMNLYDSKDFTKFAPNSEWSEVSKIPYRFRNGDAIVYNNQIHIFGGSDYETNHYIWDGTSWIQMNSLPYNISDDHQAAVIYNNKIYLFFNNKKICMWNENNDTWTELTEAPNYVDIAIVYNDKIHIFYGTTQDKKHYAWDGTSWIELTSPTYTGFQYGYAVVYDNKIHMFGGYNTTSSGLKYHITWDDISWNWITTDTSNYNTLPYHFRNGTAVVYHNQIHMFGGNNNNNSNESNNTRKHYNYTDNSWEWSSVNTLPYDFTSAGRAVVLNDEIHILSGYSGDNFYNHYKWDGTHILKMCHIISFENDVITMQDGSRYQITADCSLRELSPVTITTINDYNIPFYQRGAESSPFDGIYIYGD